MYIGLATVPETCGELWQGRQEERHLVHTQIIESSTLSPAIIDDEIYYLLNGLLKEVFINLTSFS